MSMQRSTAAGSFQWWWTLIGAAVGAGTGWVFPAVGIPLGAGLGLVAGLAVALLRMSRQWRGARAARPHFHERPDRHRGPAHKQH